MPRALLIITLFMSLLSPVAGAQPSQKEPASATSPQYSEQPISQADMREMARAMKSMADMCQVMMQREMQLKPYWMMAGGVIGTILVIALSLFVVLEIQWIRYFTLRIKRERERLK